MRGWREHLTFECPYCDETGDHFCFPGLFTYIQYEEPGLMESFRDLYIKLSEAGVIPPLEEMYERLEAIEQEDDTDDGNE